MQWQEEPQESKSQMCPPALMAASVVEWKDLEEPLSTSKQLFVVVFFRSLAKAQLTFIEQLHHRAQYRLKDKKRNHIKPLH